MIVRILAGGPEQIIPDIFSNREDIVWIGVDRGAVRLLQHDIEPSYAFGDFDSVSESDKQAIQLRDHVYVFPAEKDKTDLELAIDWVLRQGWEHVEIYGATGGRIDHELANLRLLAKSLGYHSHLYLMDQNNVISVCSPGDYALSYWASYPYVSFIPLFGEVKGLTLDDGFRYPLDVVTVAKGSTLTVSNELVRETGTYSFVSGELLVIRSCDTVTS